MLKVFKTFHSIRQLEDFGSKLIGESLLGPAWWAAEIMLPFLDT